ncbi:hypothetical protein CTAM01_00544 [Colletotrichum tamarilloi]|uniref:Ubiquitin 3 binding protein But2 C-terminal domain-containing protein n=1 Tax=Colletotrichum tamarilloi TaxID=1209934 RepID=A0ABQ9RUW0_9PEZI|nr:uncharacterized protein CTAM01_00544 [Colletotrichum tamarilloi]KAI3544048.1 hypothetical protein CSPX01_05803 [Colletotrichum filicis]KAK1513148.1 hypothetical protein CTAM01_00544 [Colletotrichum tamarilloi]
MYIQKNMARPSIIVSMLVLSLSGTAFGRPSFFGKQQQHDAMTDCARVDAPTSLTWLLQDQPFEQEDPSAFFYVNQDIDASGNKANRVAQLVTFGGVQGQQESTECRLLFTMPEDSESWELIQREGATTMRVFRVPSYEGDDSVRQKQNLLGTVLVKPGTQSIDLGQCDGSGSFVFELADAGRSRVAFRQASKPKDGFGVFMAHGCPVPRRTESEDL